MFLHLRDFYGMTQVVIEASGATERLMDRLRRLQLESVVAVTGVVRRRPPGQENPSIPTGQVEVVAQEVDVLAAVTEALPFLPDKGQEVGEEVRLRHRYLDLRRPSMREMLVQRDRLTRIIREVLGGRGFVEVHTPILSNSSPEGARDYLVPSRLHRGRFYALPQAPQQWKQLLMASGVDRYFQIAPCFRDEAARADRSPGEFYQLDLEMAFVEQEDVLGEVESAVVEIGERFGASGIVTPFPRITYDDAIERYGSDKPDLRFGLELRTLTHAFATSSVRFLRAAVERGEAVRGLPVPGGATAFKRRDVDRFQARAKEAGVPGLAWLAWDGEEVRGSLAGAMDADEVARLRAQVGADDGTMLLVCAGPRDRIDVALSALRLEVGNLLGLRDPGTLLFAWVTDFPMYELDEETGRIVFSHNPFSMPQGGLEALEGLDPLKIRGWQYDLVCNGLELSSGAIRNNDPETLYRAFEIAGYPRALVDQQFGHMLQAFREGCPPHGGIAPGFERLLMLLTGTGSIRDVVPFPKNQKAQDLLVGAPSRVSDEQLEELGIRVLPPAPAD